MHNIPCHTQLFCAAVLYTASFLLVFVTAAYRMVVLRKDILWMKRPLWTLGYERHLLHINAWVLLHILLYTLLGVLAPAFWPIWILVGVMWEGFEYVVHHYITPHVDAKRTDIVVNTVALVTGVLVHDRFR